MQAAIRILAEADDRHPFIYVDTLPDGRRVRPNAPALAEAYYKTTQNAAVRAEYLGDGTGPAWHDSRTATDAVARPSVLHFDLLGLVQPTDRNRAKNQVYLLAARALYQILYRYRDATLRDRWWMESVGWLGKSLGVSEDTTARALDLMVEGGWLHRSKWRGHQRSERTLLAPACTKILEALKDNNAKKPHAEEDDSYVGTDGSVD